MKASEFIPRLRPTDRRHVVFALAVAAALAALYLSYGPLLSSGPHRDHYSHLIFIPVISAYFAYQNRRALAANLTFPMRWGLPVAAIGVAGCIAGLANFPRSLNDASALAAFGAVLAIMGSFAGCYGAKAFRAAAFPLFFLFFAVPIPGAVMEELIGLLQTGSTLAAHMLFLLTGIPFVRDGFVFSLPTITVEVAEQCSGIRSSLALLITSVLAGKLFLEKGRSRIALVLSVFPITIFKNGVRIVTLALLGGYVDEKILTDSAIHRNSGVLIFMLPLAMLGAVLYLLRKRETRYSRREGTS